MSDLRAAAQPALEVLDSLWQRGVWGDFHGVADNLRAALLEDAMQKFTDVNQELEAALAEPVKLVIQTWRERCEEHPDHQTGMVSHAMIQARMQEEIEALRAALAEPGQKPLTEEKIHDCFQQRDKDKATERRMITRAIERAHGIKGA